MLSNNKDKTVITKNIFAFIRVNYPLIPGFSEIAFLSPQSLDKLIFEAETSDSLFTNSLIKVKCFPSSASNVLILALKGGNCAEVEMTFGSGIAITASSPFCMMLNCAWYSAVF